MPNTPVPAAGEALPPANPITIIVNPRDRLVLATTIEALINMLDALDPDPDLEDTHDCENDTADLEPELGWTNAIDQLRARRVQAAWFAEDGEPELGWTGDGVGCRPNEPRSDREGDDEREWDQAEDGIADTGGLAEQVYQVGLHAI